MSFLLNPALADAVEKACGSVRVINAGVPLEGYYEPSVAPNGVVSNRLCIVRRGETFTANCPMCSDQRGRLAVNHRFGVPDVQTGFRGTELWKCYNEECQNDSEKRRKLWDKLYPLFSTGPARCRQPEVRQVEKGRLPPCEFPGLLVPLADLTATHPAVAYVRGRGFDPVELSQVWGVGFAESMPARGRGSASLGRLICPVRFDGIMVGYQARYLGELDWKATGVPKYLTFFPKSMTLYGIDEAAVSTYILLVEGVTDVWRYGPGAVSPLGKSLSFDQARILAEALKGRPLVVAPDADDPKAFDAFCKNVGMVSRFQPVTSGIAHIPAGRDPASLTREDLRARVARGASAASLVN